MTALTPLLLCPSAADFTDLNRTLGRQGSENAIVAFLITHYSEIFTTGLRVLLL